MERKNYRQFAKHFFDMNEDVLEKMIKEINLVEVQ